MTRFEWDPAKAVANLRKHGLSFETAIRVFADPAALFDQDRIVDGEHRWQAIGFADGFPILIVAYAIREHDETDSIRIISARRANRSERKRYEEANG
jgi:uncharacterized DUF497 family protein